MVGIHGINPNLITPVQSDGTVRPASSQDGQIVSKQDSVGFTSASRTAAEAARFISQTAAQDEIRQELIEQAKGNVEEGLHQIQSVVSVIASRVSPYTAV